MSSKPTFYTQRSREQNELLRELLLFETGLDESSQGFKKCLAASQKKLPNNNYLSVNSNSVQRKLDGLLKKFRVSSQQSKAEDLSEATRKYLTLGREADAQGREDVDVEYGVIHLLMDISRNPVNQPYQREEEVAETVAEEMIDWHAILVADFQYSDPSDDSLTSGEELESDPDDSGYCYSRILDIPDKEPETSLALVPNYSEICGSLVKQYWRNDINLEPLTELQILRETLTMLQGAPTSYVFPVFEDKVYLRENITVPHYSFDALNSILKFFEENIQMIQTLHFLSDDILNYVAQPSHPYGSRTFQAFACAIFMYLQQLTSSLSDIERKIMAQEDIVTVIHLKEAVREHFEIVTALYDMVDDVLQETDLDSPSVCVTNLINTMFETLELYESMGILTQHITKVLLTIVLCTLQPLLSTIDTWLSHGDLNNSTGELFLTRDIDISISSSNFWNEGLVFKHPDQAMEKQIPGILLPLKDKMLKSGKAIELISELGKLAEPDIDLFHVLITRYLGKPLCDVHPEQDVPLFTFNIEQSQGDDIDPLLSGLFVDMAANLSPAKDLKHRIYNHIYSAVDELYILPSTLILKILVPLLEERCTQVSFSLLKILRNDFALDDHLNTLRKVLLMEAGLPMSQFCEELFKDVYGGETMRSMTSFLRECMSKHTSFSKNLRMQIVTKAQNNSKPHKSELDVFQSVKIDYIPPFPIDIILDEELLQIYQKVFTLLIQIKYAGWCVLPLAIQSHQHSPLSNQVYCFQHELVNFIKVVQAYTMQRVLHCTGADMRLELTKAQELDEYVEIHKKYCQIMEEYCLLTPEFSFCLGAIRHALCKGIQFRRALDAETVNEDELQLIMKDVRKCIDFVTNLVKKRNQVASVPQPHFDWLETALT